MIDWVMIWFWVALAAVSIGVSVHTIQTRRWLKLMERVLESHDRELWEEAQRKNLADLKWARFFTFAALWALGMMLFSTLTT